MKMKMPKWATPANEMNHEALRFAVAAQDVIECKHLGFTRAQYLASFKVTYWAQAAKDWDAVTELQGGGK